MTRHGVNCEGQEIQRPSLQHLISTLRSLFSGHRLTGKGFTCILLPSMLITVSLSAQTSDPGSTFSDLSTQYDGGVANPTDGSTGNVLQQTMLAAYQWGIAHGGARATVVVAAEYPIHGSRLLVPGNVDLVCSSYSPMTYGGGCPLLQTDPGDDTTTGGSPLLMVDYEYGFLPDLRTPCSTFDQPQHPGCLIVNGSGAAIRGFSLSGAGVSAGGQDVGIRVAANAVHIQDTSEQFFGGQGILSVAGLNSSYDWNFGTNVDEWWCAHPSQIDRRLGGIDLGGMIDGEASHNQYSTGCAFIKGYRSSLEYPLLGSMHVGGAGNLIEANLLQADGIGLIVEGQEQRVIANRAEFQSREAILSIAMTSIFSNNIVLSACLDPNLDNLRPGSLDGGVPLYPSVPALFHVGQIVMDASGNVEQVIAGANGSSTGSSDVAVPDWAVTSGGIAYSNDLTWMNIGPWQPGSSATTDSGSVPALVSGLCYAVVDRGAGNSWNANLDGVEVGIGGPSYLRGEYFLSLPSQITGNKCHQDWPDAYGNGQCWWGGDLYSNGGPPWMPPNENTITASGGGTAWVGDYGTLALADAVSHHYNNFQGMSAGQRFLVTSLSVANYIDPWSLYGSQGSVYGHPAVVTCSGAPLLIKPGQYFEFIYDADGRNWVTQINCQYNGASESTSGGLDVSPGSLTFSAQVDSTVSVAQQISVSNISSMGMALTISGTGDFSDSSSCPSMLAAGASCSVSVTFNPSRAGQRTGVLSVGDSISGFSQNVALSGMGLDLSSAVPWISLSSASSSLHLPAGANATADLVVAPVNGYSGSVTLTCAVRAADGAIAATLPTCTLTNGTILLSSGKASALQLYVSTAPTNAALRKPPSTSLCGFPLAGLGALGLFALARRRKIVVGMLLALTCIGWLAGCGYTPNAGKPIAFDVVITASAGKSNTSLTIPLDVQ
jgi:hypothetical protein